MTLFWGFPALNHVLGFCGTVGEWVSQDNSCHHSHPRSRNQSWLPLLGKGACDLLETDFLKPKDLPSHPPTLGGPEQNGTVVSKFGKWFSQRAPKLCHPGRNLDVNVYV